jgi:hypothetical protein
MSTVSSPDTHKVFGSIYVHDQAKPAHVGETMLNLVKGRAHVVQTIRKIFPNVRKVSLCVLRSSKDEILVVPKWFADCGGHFEFPKSIARTRTKAKAKKLRRK